MATVSFTPNLEGALGCRLGAQQVQGASVAAALEEVFAVHPRLRGYILDDQGALRKHVAVFLDGSNIGDRQSLSDALPEDGELFVAQALSGG